MNTKKILLFLSVLSFFACNRNVESTTTEEIPLKKISVPLTISCLNSNNNTANVLSTEMTNVIIRSLKKFEGFQPTLISSIPDKWIVECQIESFSPNFDIWIITNEGEPIFKLIATINVENNEIIQAIPIAYSVANEKNKYVESEFWDCQIDNVYNIVVHKKYEKLYSLSDEGYKEEESTTIVKDDKYIIENHGEITYLPQPTFDIDYQAVVFFADTSIVSPTTDNEWLWNAITLHENLEPYNILFVETFKDFDQVVINNYLGETVDIVDIKKFTNIYNKGYLVLAKNKETQFIAYDTPVNCLSKIMNIFGIKNWQLETDSPNDSLLEQESPENLFD